MAEPSTFSALSSPSGRLRTSRVSTALPHHPRRAGLDEPFAAPARLKAQARPAAPSAELEPAPARRQEEVEVEDPSARLRAAEHASAERTLRGALLFSLLLNLVVFLGVGLSLPVGPLTQADALLAAVTLVAAVGLLVLGEICRKGGPPSRS